MIRVRNNCFFFLRFHRNYVRYIGCRWSKKNNNDQCVVARGLLAFRYKSSFSFLPLARFSQSTDSRSSRKHTQRVERDSILQFNCRPAGSLIIRVAFIFFIVEQSRATNVRRWGFSLNNFYFRMLQFISSRLGMERNRILLLFSCSWQVFLDSLLNKDEKMMLDHFFFFWTCNQLLREYICIFKYELDFLRIIELHLYKFTTFEKFVKSIV